MTALPSATRVALEMAVRAASAALFQARAARARHTEDGTRLRPESREVTGYNGRPPGLFRGTAAYAAASVAGRAIGFALLPLYARVLSPNEYGQIAVVTAISSAVGALVAFGLETAVFRARAQTDEEVGEFDRFLSGVGLFAVAAPAAIAAVVAITVGPFLASVFNAPAVAIQVSLIGSALFASATVLPLAVLRAEERLRDYVALTGLHVVVGTTATLAFVIGLRWGVIGWVLAIAIASGVLLIGGLALLGRRWRPGFDREVLRQALAFGVPLVPHALAHWALSLSDRAVLGAFVDPSQTGAYYVAYQLTLPTSVLAIAVSRSLQPLYARASASNAARRRIGKSAADQILVVVLLGVGTAVVGPSFVAAILPNSYAEAQLYIPVLAIGVALFGLSLIPTDAVALMAGRTRWVWTVTVAAAIGNIGLNLLFVPSAGPMAAAVSTTASYAVLLLGGVLLVWQIPQARLPIPWRRLVAGLALIGVMAMGAVVSGLSDSLGSLIVKAGVFAAGAVALLLTARSRTGD